MLPPLSLRQAFLPGYGSSGVARMCRSIVIAKESGLGMQFVLPKTLVDNLLEEGNYPASEL